MKMNKIFSALMLIGAVIATACDPINNPPLPPDPDKDTTGINKPEPKPESDTLTVADILKMKEDGTLPAKDAGTEKKWVKAYIVGSYNFDADPKFVIGTANASGTSLLLADDPESTDTYKVASVKLSAGKFRDALNLVAHPENYKKELKLYGIVEAYCGIGGIVNIEEAYLDGENVGTIEVGEIDYQDGELSVSDFLAVEEIKNLASGATTETEYVVRGIVQSVVKVDLSYGNAQFYITDGEKELLCYNIAGVNKEKFVSAKQLEVGDIVTVKSVVTNYSGTIEPKGGYLTRTTNTFDPSTVEGPKEATIAEILALGLADGATSAEQYKVSGMIAKVTEASTDYGNLTFDIEDGNGNTLTCYRVYYLDNKKYTATDPALEVGDNVTLIAQVKNHYGTIELVQGYVSAHTK
ncbi:MAG: DUF6359 domain-containing protein [Bacteroidales bacterium]|nr:DUF6359 domain-containing protein [Bacteroidales bacterium]